MLAVATALVAACAPAPVQTPASPVPTGPSYVAMGDSAATAPLVPAQGRPTGCFKSTNNYPSVLSRRLDVGSFTDVTCSGARTEDLVSRSQPTRSGAVPPQVDAVRPDTELVTITIGGNDVDLSTRAAGCRRTSLGAAPCSADFVVDGVDTVSQAIEAQSSSISGISGATFTSNGFAQSLASALTQAGLS